MNAVTANAASAPDAATETSSNKKEPAWLRMPETEFLALCKKNGWGGKRLEEFKARRAAAASQVARDEDALDEALAQQDAALEQQRAEDKSLAAAAEDGARKALEVVKQRRAAASPGLVAAIGERMKVIKAAPAPGLVTRYIDPNLIDVREGWNARIDFGDLEELKESIRAQKRLDGHGLVNDVRVKEKPDGRFELIDGERRYHSVMGLIDDGEVFEFGIPAKVEPAESTDADLIIKMFTANMGKPFLPYEEALYYDRLKKSGMTLREIEEKTGRSDNSIVGALALLEADEDLVQAVIKGQVGATLGKSIAVNVRGNKQRQKELTAKAREASAAAKKGDHGKMRAVKKEVDDERRAKAARTSKKLAERMAAKPRKAEVTDINAQGLAVAERLKELMEKLEMSVEDTDLRAWVSDDRELQVAAQFGALTALQWVMGGKVKVEF